jgi:PAS domain S-box-containing protein
MKKEKKWSFSNYLLLLIFILIIVLVAGITIGDYIIAENNYRENADLIKEQTERDIATMVYAIDGGLKLYDDTLNRQMEEGTDVIRLKYDAAGGNPSLLDLEAIKGELGGRMDIYFINESGTVVATTNARYDGFDFRKYDPGFNESLTKIRFSESFSADRVVPDFLDGTLTKWGYMQTVDHRYVVAMSFSEQYFREDRDTLNYASAVDSILQTNPFVNNIRIFSTGKKLIGTPAFRPGYALDQTLEEIITSKNSIRTTDPASGNTVKYQYIDLSDEAYPSDMSLIVELTYNDLLFQDTMDKIIFFHIFVAIIALICGTIIALGVTEYLTRPLEDISHDLDAIAQGDLDHSISPTLGMEFETLEKSITHMVKSLKTAIFQLKEGEERLRTSEERYRAVVQSQTEFIIRFLPDRTITFVNDAYCRYFGMSCDELLGKKFFPHTPEKDWEQLSDYFTTLTPEKPFGSVEHLIITPVGEVRWHQWNDLAIFDNNGTIVEYQSVGRDITDIKLAAEEIKKLNEELEQRVRERTTALEEANRELESFSYSVSHDLRAPLRAIDGFSVMLLDALKSSLDPKSRRYIEKIRENTHAMSRLIEDLLNFSRMSRQSLSRMPVKPDKIAVEAFNEQRPDRQDRNIEFIIGPLPEARADPLLLKLVFSNLLANAIKFTRDRDPARIEIGALHFPEQEVYFIRDNGVGFDMQYADKIFGVFQRLHTSSEFEGTGVGLAIVQRIIHRHGGKIWVESRIGEGTTFFFTLGRDHDND